MVYDVVKPQSGNDCYVSIIEQVCVCLSGRLKKSMPLAVSQKKKVLPKKTKKRFTKKKKVLQKPHKKRFPPQKNKFRLINTGGTP